MLDRLGFVSATGIVWGAVALVVVVAWTLLSGEGLFSAGGLNAVSNGRSLGGVTSHAQLNGRCGACHTAFWSPVTMAGRCEVCHADVSDQIQNHTGLHGGLLGALATPTCGNCHSEHGGPNGPLTANFDHNVLTFKLRGKHATVACNLCHVNAGSLQDLRNTPQDCFSCHAKNDAHAGKFGQQCGQCHTPDSWKNAKFDHTIFPVDHGSREQVATCATCHPDGVTTYTCFGCHRHTVANVQADHEGRTAAVLADCVRCHAGGRGGGD